MSCQQQLIHVSEGDILDAAPAENRAHTITNIQEIHRAGSSYSLDRDLIEAPCIFGSLHFIEAFLHFYFYCFLIYLEPSNMIFSALILKVICLSHFSYCFRVEELFRIW